MDFRSAMEAMQSGARVTRNEWLNDLYFIIVENEVRAYQKCIRLFQYTDDIMISDGWEVEREGNEFKFYDIVPFLKKGKCARLNSWPKDTYIFYYPTNMQLMLHEMSMLPYNPDFQAFVSDDWLVIE